jgi:hypothetical protein
MCSKVHNSVTELLITSACILLDSPKPNMTGLVRDFLRMCVWEMLSHPVFSPDMSLPGFGLLAKFKKRLLRGSRFCGVEGASSEVTQVIRLINKGFPLAGKQEVPERWEVVTRLIGYCVEGRYRCLVK